MGSFYDASPNDGVFRNTSHRYSEGDLYIFGLHFAYQENGHFLGRPRIVGDSHSVSSHIRENYCTGKKDRKTQDKIEGLSSSRYEGKTFKQHDRGTETNGDST